MQFIINIGLLVLAVAGESADIGSQWKESVPNYYSPPAGDAPTTQLAPDTLEPLPDYGYESNEYDDYPPPTLSDLYLYRFDPSTGMDIPILDIPIKKFTGLSSELALFDPWFKSQV